MRIWPVAIIGLMLVAAAFVLLRNEKEPPVPSNPPTSTNTDASEVFKRAFWKRPTGNDKILHAERREWADADGVQKWQWFIAVDPSEELASYLKQNPFRLNDPKGEAKLPTEAPEWFPKSGSDFQVQQSPNGEMIILLSKKSGRLFAAGQGLGFAKGSDSSDAPPANTDVDPIGRLPAKSPPVPERL